MPAEGIDDHGVKALLVGIGAESGYGGQAGVAGGRGRGRGGGLGDQVAGEDFVKRDPAICKFELYFQGTGTRTRTHLRRVNKRGPAKKESMTFVAGFQLSLVVLRLT